MAVREIKKGNSTYIVFGYRDGDKVRSTYCGRKELAKTDENIKKAKRQWYEMHLKKMREKLSS